VLLDAKAEPFLTDFGLARLVEKDSNLTRTTAMLGTPSYMSPEQARGEAKQLTTAVDVYGLGAVFYELLTGHPPFTGSTTMETVRQVLEKEPRRPSMMRAAVDRDLETICLKCLEKEPARRYRSAEALAEDLERWLGHEPILARPARPAERFAKWVRRNRTAFAALVSIVVVLTAGLTVSIWQAVRARDAEELAYHRLAESQASEARAVKAAAAEKAARNSAFIVRTFLLNVFSINATRRDGAKVTLAEILDTATEELDSIERRPEETKSLAQAIGNCYLALRLYDKAVPLLRKHRDCCLSTLGPDERETCAAEGLLAVALANSGQVAEAQEIRESVLQRYRRLRGPEGEDALLVMQSLGDTWAANGEPEKAASILEELLSIRSRVSGPEHTDTHSVRESLSDACMAAGSFGKAADLREQLAAWTIQHASENPDKVHIFNKAALACLRAGRVPAALQHWADASAANDHDRIRDIWFAGLLVWFGGGAEHAAMSVRLLKAVAGTDDAGTANCVAKLVSIRPPAGPETGALATAIARRAVALGQSDSLLPWYYLSLGMAEYREAHFPEAAAALLEADRSAAHSQPDHRSYIQSTAGIYRAMILSREGDNTGAMETLVRAANGMKPLPENGKDPLSENANQDDLVLWLAYKEAKAMIEAPP